MAAIYQRRKVDQKGWRYVRVNIGRGRRPADAPPYYLRFTVNGQRKWSEPFQTFEAVKEAAGVLPDVLEAKSKNISLDDLKEQRDAHRVPIRVAVETYLEQKKNKARRTVLAYRLILGQFASLVSVRFLDEITADVLRDYKTALERLELAGKTIDTRLNILYFMLKKNGVSARIPNDEMPVVEEMPAKPFSEEEIKKLLAGMNNEEKLLYSFFLGSGCRDREVMFASWADVNFSEETFTVTSKPEMGFTVKNHEQRTVRLPSSLIQWLKSHREHRHERWIFATEKGLPANHFLRKLKKIARRAGLNCGHCKASVTAGMGEHKRKIEVTCKTHPVCQHIYLHRLRKTCATRWAKGTRAVKGIDVRTIQYWLGHKNLETTMRYLGITDNRELSDQVNAAFGD